MAAGETWSPKEVRASVLDYMAMLQFELAGQTYSKTAHRRALLRQLRNRSEAAIELKHQNVSAVLRDLGHFWIPGYKPRSNYQKLLADEVEMWVASHPELDRYALAAAEAPAAKPDHLNFDAFQVSHPAISSERTQGAGEPHAPYNAAPRIGRKRDYAAREAYNRSLGRAGEELVVEFERFRLKKAGHSRLAEKVEHVSVTEGDGLGFDVRSFDTRGKDFFIEVKTTTFAKETPFYASASELTFARQNADQFALYRVFEFRKNPRCFTLAGDIRSHCSLDPVTYRCAFN